MGLRRSSNLLGKLTDNMMTSIPGNLIFKLECLMIAYRADAVSPIIEGFIASRKFLEKTMMSMVYLKNRGSLCQI